MAAVLLQLLYPCMGAVSGCKSLMSNDFTDFYGLRSSARRHVIPQFCGIYQS